MYQVGDKVVYGIQGVCCVTGFEEKNIDRKHLIYMVLEPVERDGSRYLVPTHNASAMGKLRPMLTREGLESLLHSEAVHADGWIADENLRKQTYRELISSGDREKLMQMVCTLYRHKKTQTAAGRKCHLCDENFLRDAEKLLASETCVVLGMDMLQSRQYIRDALNS